MSFVIPDYADKTPVYMAHPNIDRIYTEINHHKCSQYHYYLYLQYISDNDHPVPTW